MSEQPRLSFPCPFPIKVMGKNGIEFEQAVLTIVRRHAPDITEGAIRQRPSGKGNYLAITVTVNATSQAQLDALYIDLSGCEQVVMVI